MLELYVETLKINHPSCNSSRKGSEARSSDLLNSPRARKEYKFDLSTSIRKNTTEENKTNGSGEKKILHEAEVMEFKLEVNLTPFKNEKTIINLLKLNILEFLEFLIIQNNR